MIGLDTKKQVVGLGGNEHKTLQRLHEQKICYLPVNTIYERIDVIMPCCSIIVQRQRIIPLTGKNKILLES
ncbi:MAG TPA: hypothetical protein VFH25_09430 [Nitrososphaeraceae archaeon]|nr:hypothetical protein [Nitrososphaeraceae archaeon]HEX5977959.1 hypothetical protein [Nitrososphaeraceae archaeon]